MIREALPCDRLAIHVPQSEREEQMQNTPDPRGALPPGDTKGRTSEQLLLVTKLAMSPVRSDLVPRPRLTNQLQLGIQRPLTLIAAPAGFGKTTLLSTWLEHASGPMCSLLSRASIRASGHPPWRSFRHPLSRLFHP